MLTSRLYFLLALYIYFLEVDFLCMQSNNCYLQSKRNFVNNIFDEKPRNFYHFFMFIACGNLAKDNFSIKISKSRIFLFKNFSKQLSHLSSVSYFSCICFIKKIERCHARTATLLLHILIF